MHPRDLLSLPIVLYFQIERTVAIVATGMFSERNDVMHDAVTVSMGTDNDNEKLYKYITTNQSDASRTENDFTDRSCIECLIPLLFLIDTSIWWRKKHVISLAGFNTIQCDFFSFGSGLLFRPPWRLYCIITVINRLKVRSASALYI